MARLRVAATPEQVGRVAAAAQQVLVELRDGDGADLEDLFFTLTSDDRRREEVAA